MQVGNRQEAENRVLCDDEQVTLQVGSKKFQALVGNLRKLPKLLSTTFPETPIQMPANGVFKIERDPAVFGAVVELLESNSMPSSVSEEKLAEELAFFGCNLDDLELLEDESCDTESDSPQKQVPSNVRVAVDSAPMDQRLLATYSMRADEMFGRAVALVRQEDTIVKITDIQHGLALLRELLSVERNNVAFMFYMSYGELRLGRTTEASYWIDKVLKLDPCNLAASSLKTLINDRRKQNSMTGLLVVGAALTAAASAWFFVSRRSE